MKGMQLLDRQGNLIDQSFKDEQMPFKNEEEEHANLEVMSQDILNLEIRSFTNLKKKPT